MRNGFEQDSKNLFTWGIYDMKNTLYVSDLDGTLFNSSKKISERTAQILNRCIAKGMKFAVATARMPYGCDYRLKEINMDTPGILTNGVFLYDFQREKIIAAEAVSQKSALEAVDAFRRHGLSCFVYTYEENGISIYYEDEVLQAQTQYYSDRALESCEEVKLVEDVREVLAEKKPVYLAYTGPKEVLEPVCEELDNIEEISYSFYLNVYNGWYCLEVFSETASKKNALLKLQDLLKCQEIVVFGDNLNDISMMEIADRSYVPANALAEVKKLAARILADCDHDGVAEFLAEEWEV